MPNPNVLPAVPSPNVLPINLLRCPHIYVTSGKGRQASGSCPQPHGDCQCVPHFLTTRQNVVQPGQTYTGPEVSGQEAQCPRLLHVPAGARAWQRSKKRRGHQLQDTDPALGPGTADRFQAKTIFHLILQLWAGAPSPNTSLGTSPVQSDSPRGPDFLWKLSATEIKAPSFQTISCGGDKVPAGSGGFGETGPRAAPVPSQWWDTPVGTHSSHRSPSTCI